MYKVLSAPGKLFLTGEYSVLWGGTARVLATGKRLHVAIRERSDLRVTVSIPAETHLGNASALGVKWDHPLSNSLLFVGRSIDFALRASDVIQGFDLSIEPSIQANEIKMGFGSSACVSVLTVEAIRMVNRQSFDSLKLALLAHASAQNHKGSGGDVAACFAGSLTRYQKYDLHQLLQASNKEMLRPALALAPPVAVMKFDAPWLPMFYAFTGSSQSTTSSITAMETRFSSAQKSAFVNESDAMGDVVESALRNADFSSLKDPIDGLQLLLDRSTLQVSASIDRMRKLASTCGCVGKQSGASGGDGAIFIAPDVSSRAAAMELIASRGFLTFPLSIERGMRSEANAPPPLLELLSQAESDD